MFEAHTMSMIPLRPLTVLAALALAIAAAPAGAQATSSRGEAEFRWSKALPPGSVVRLSNIAGDVRVIASDGNQVELVARRRRGDSDSEARVEVAEHADGVTICALYGDDSYCDERGSHQNRGRRRSWNDDHGYYDFEVRVPTAMRVSAGSVSGDVHVSGTAGRLSASSVSGDVRLEQVQADDELTAKSVSGDVTAGLRSVANGADLDISSVSGDVRITMPSSTGFDLRMSTVSGDLETDFALALRGRFNRRSISAQINKGGSDLRISTVSGDVRLAHDNQ